MNTASAIVYLVSGAVMLISACFPEHLPWVFALASFVIFAFSGIVMILTSRGAKREQAHPPEAGS